MNALLWALGEARAPTIPVHAVLAWQPHTTWSDPGLGSMFPMTYNPGAAGSDQAASANDLLDAAVTQATSSDPDRGSAPVRITRETVHGHPAQVLLDTGTDGDLLVVGSHGHGGFVGAVLGSISQHVVSHARCPVVIIPAAQRMTET